VPAHAIRGKRVVARQEGGIGRPATFSDRERELFGGARNGRVPRLTPTGRLIGGVGTGSFRGLTAGSPSVVARDECPQSADHDLVLVQIERVDDRALAGRLIGRDHLKRSPRYEGRLVLRAFGRGGGEFESVASRYSEARGERRCSSQEAAVEPQKIGSGVSTTPVRSRTRSRTKHSNASSSVAVAPS